MVGLASQGGAVPSPTGPPHAAIVSSPPASDPPVGQRHLTLDLPARRGDVVTTRELIVRGRVTRSIGEVRIILESRGGKPIAAATIDPTDFGHEAWIPFESRFRLAFPRPGGDMVVFLIAVDAQGIPIDAIRRRFTMGAIVDIP